MAGARCGGACAPPFPPPRPGRAGAPSGRPPARAHRGFRGQRRPFRGAAAGESAHELPWRRLRSLRRRLPAPMPAHTARAGWGALGQTSSEGTPGLPGPAAAVSRRCRPEKASPAGMVAMSPHDAAQRFHARPRPNEFSPARSCSMYPARLPFAGCLGLSGALAGQKVLHIGLLATTHAVVF